jgi:hypothetical protein
VLWLPAAAAAPVVKPATETMSAVETVAEVEMLKMDFIVEVTQHAMLVMVELKLPEDKALNADPVKTDRQELVVMHGQVAVAIQQAAAAAVGLAAAEPTTTVVAAAALAMPTPT